jgi:hypothetical protein
MLTDIFGFALCKSPSSAVRPFRFGILSIEFINFRVRDYFVGNGAPPVWRVIEKVSVFIGHMRVARLLIGPTLLSAIKAEMSATLTLNMIASVNFGHNHTTLGIGTFSVTRRQL